MVLLRLAAPASANTPLTLQVSYTGGRASKEGVAPARARTRHTHAHRCLPACLPAHATADRGGQARTSQRTVAVPPQARAGVAAQQGSPAAYYQSNGVEKAVLLARYTDLLHDW